jgi:TatD DNase family protein
MTAPLPFYDTHAHLDYPDFESDLPEVLARAQAAGITRLIAIGTDLDSSGRAVALADRFEPVYAAVGWHPGHVTAAPSDLRPALRDLARHPKVVALGETGLDHYRLPSGQQGGTAADDQAYKARQADLFQQHLEVAAELGLPCVVHQRACLEDALAQWTPMAGRVRAVFHCFVDSIDVARRIIALDGLVSFTGIVTFKNAQVVCDTIRQTPLDRLLLETDCPFLAPVPYRGKRCEPAYVREIADAVARAKGCSLDDLSEATCRTADEFFRRLPPRLHASHSGGGSGTGEARR